MSNQLFPALLRFWRTRRGLSQLDLAIEAQVSARHLSFLESGRAKPSAEMVLRLLSVLHVPLRAQDEALRAAGLSARFAERRLETIDPEVDRALSRMLEQQEPFPLVVLGRDYGILRSNRGAEALFRRFIAEPARLPDAPDIFTLFFDPKLIRPFVVDWPSFARRQISRLQRELLQRGGDERLRALLERIMALPDVPASFRQPDFSSAAPATQTMCLTRGELSVGFLVAVTKFSAPGQVLLDELSVETCFPLDEATRVTCERLGHA